MGREFEVREEITLDATPEQVWAAIATGPGIDSWFMGRNEVEPRAGGTAKADFGGFAMESTVTAWEPLKHFATRSEPGPDGSFMAFEYLIEGRDQGSTVLRFVHSGFLAGDDWESEYDALKVGDGMYLRKLAVYVKHFPGAVAAYSLFLVGPQVADSDRVRRAFTAALGGEATVGARVNLAVEGLPATEGVVEFARQRPNFVGVRTDDGIYMLIHGHMDTVVVEHHRYTTDASQKETEAAWQGWLERSFP